MSIFRVTEIAYNGEKYSLKPNLALLRHIERQRISLIALASNLGKGQPQASLLVEVIGIVLRHAGAPFTQADEEQLVAQFMFGDADQMTDILELWGQVLGAISPEIPEKNVEPSSDE
jgi:hypothetical protein